MKIIIPAREVEVCDLCHNATGCISNCDVCRNLYCFHCVGTVCGSYGFTSLCRACAIRKDVKSVCDRFATKLSPLFKQRDEALRALRGDA